MSPESRASHPAAPTCPTERPDRKAAAGGGRCVGDRPAASAAHPILRPERPDDAAFLAWLFAADAGALLRRAGLPESTVAHLVDVQQRARDMTYRAAFPQARCSIAECGGAPVGRLIQADEPERAHIVDIAIDPAWRRRGIATALLRGAMADWAAAGRGGRADVFVGNTASLAMFAGLGFVGKPEPGAAQIALTWRP